MAMDPDGPVEEEVVETRRTVPAGREVVRTRYVPVSDPIGGIIGLIVLVAVIIFLLELFGITNFFG